MDLASKRAKVIADHQAQERFDPHWKAEADKGRKLSERPVALLCDDEVVVLGDCIAKVAAGLQKFKELVAANAPAWEERRKKEPSVAQAFNKIDRFLASNTSGELRLSQKDWNALLFGLNEADVHVVLTDGSN